MLFQKKLQKTLSLKKKLIWKIMKKLILKIMNNFNNYRLLKFMIQVKEKNKQTKEHVIRKRRRSSNL